MEKKQQELSFASIWLLFAFFFLAPSLSLSVFVHSEASGARRNQCQCSGTFRPTGRAIVGVELILETSTNGDVLGRVLLQECGSSRAS